MKQILAITVNGQPRTITSHPERPLLEVLREDLQLTGTKYGCGEGRCGACTVLMNGKSVHACMTPVKEANHQTILTVEGLVNGDQLHPVQEAFLEENAFQCGYCTPGMMMGLVGLLQETPIPSDPDILSRMEGHLCRCCGYPNILNAIKRAAATARRK